MAESANSRLAAFCDGVFGIALTLLIIDIKLPSVESIHSTGDVWHALARLGPMVFAFLLSFGIILITWVNHHGLLRLVHSSSAAFIYANGFLLLTVVFIPFPTSLLGDFVWTDYAAPAVVLYNAVLAVQSIAWILVTRAALRGGLTIEGRAMETMQKSNRNGHYAVAFYSLLAMLAWWFPLAIAIVTTASWVFWLVLGIRLKHAG